MNKAQILEVIGRFGYTTFDQSSEIAEALAKQIEQPDSGRDAALTIARNALEYYADPKNNTPGALAREALEKIATVQPDSGRDAARYRWLKECNGGPIGIVAWHRDEEKEMVLTEQYADEAIDAAMAAHQGEKPAGAA